MQQRKKKKDSQPVCVSLEFRFDGVMRGIGLHAHVLHRILTVCVLLLQKDEVYLNLVLDYVPETVYRVARHYSRAKQTLPMVYVKVGSYTFLLLPFFFFFVVNQNKKKVMLVVCVLQLYMYQLFRSLAYIHSFGICHRDIKPQNLLLDPETAVLKLCDFGRSVLGHVFAPTHTHTSALAWVSPFTFLHMLYNRDVKVFHVALVVYKRPCSTRVNSTIM